MFSSLRKARVKHLLIFTQALDCATQYANGSSPGLGLRKGQLHEATSLFDNSSQYLSEFTTHWIGIEPIHALDKHYHRHACHTCDLCLGFADFLEAPCLSMEGALANVPASGSGKAKSKAKAKAKPKQKRTTDDPDTE